LQKKIIWNFLENKLNMWIRFCFSSFILLLQRDDEYEYFFVSDPRIDLNSIPLSIRVYFTILRAFVFVSRPWKICTLQLSLHFFLRWLFAVYARTFDICIVIYCILYLLYSIYVYVCACIHFSTNVCDFYTLFLYIFIWRCLFSLLFYF